MSLYLGDQQVAGVSTPIQGARNIGQLIYSLIPLTDAGLHLTDGALIDGNGIYSAFYNYMLNLYGDGTNPPNYFTDETSWQNSVTTYGVCGKFVIDTTNQTIRLPKITGIIEGTLDVNALGNLVEAGLPNIKGSFNSAAGGFTTSGPLFSVSNWSYQATGSGHANQGVEFDASRYNSIYSDSVNTVQPQTIKGYYYIVLATTTKTEIEINIDEVTTEINNLSRAYIVETYSNGTDWYRVWSDGWCEQGGQITAAQEGNGMKTITYLIPFSSEPTVIITAKGSAYTNWAQFQNGCNAQTSTSTQFTTFVDGNIPAKNWIACGYKA